MGYGQHATPRSRGFLRNVLSWAFYIALVFALVWGLQTFVVCPYTIPSGSMEDTIEVGDNVWSEKVSYYFRDVEQGDIVTFDDPEIAANAHQACDSCWRSDRRSCRRPCVRGRDGS